MPLRWPSLFHTFIILSTSKQDNGDCDNDSVQRWRARVGGCRSQSICSAPVPALNNSAPLFPHFPHILHQSALHSTTTLDTIHHKFLPNWAPVLPQGRPPPAKTVFCRGLNQLNKGRGGGPWLTAKFSLATQFGCHRIWQTHSALWTMFTVFSSSNIQWQDFTDGVS